MALKRIACVSNYDCEMYPEKFVHISNMDHMEDSAASRVCAELNRVNPDGPHYYKPVELDYVLYEFKP